MRKLFISCTLFFWLVVGGLWAAAMRQSSVSVAQLSSGEKSYTLVDVAKHKSATDCWMVIRGQVYNLSSYVMTHPSEPQIFLPWCGKEATDAYRTKTIGESHRSSADHLLPTYRIGALQ